MLTRDLTLTNTTLRMLTLTNQKLKKLTITLTNHGLTPDLSLTNSRTATKHMPLSAMCALMNSRLWSRMNFSATNATLLYELELR